MLTTILAVLLALYILQALLKFAVHFLVPYDTRRRRIEAMYTGRAIGAYDDLVSLLMLVLIGLLIWSGAFEPLSFWTGLVVGMTLIQVYFHRFSQPVAPDKAPEPPLTPIRLISFAIQARPSLAWKEYAIMALLFIWALASLVALIAESLRGPG
jgi:hypothetical protein